MVAAVAATRARSPQDENEKQHESCSHDSTPPIGTIPTSGRLTKADGTSVSVNLVTEEGDLWTDLWVNGSAHRIALKQIAWYKYRPPGMTTPADRLPQ